MLKMLKKLKIRHVLFSFLIPTMWIFRKITYGKLYEKQKLSLKGKNILVIGGNGDIGREVVLDLFKSEANVYLACRNIDLARNFLKKLIYKLEEDRLNSIDINNQEKIQYMKKIYQKNVFHFNLCDYKSIENITLYFKENNIKLDLLINCAGLIELDVSTKTEDNINTVFQTNHLGPHCLVKSFLKSSIFNKNSRIIYLIHETFNSIILKPDEIKNDMFTQYSNKKIGKSEGLFNFSISNLAKIYSIYDLKEVINKDKENLSVKIFLVNPGMVYTKFKDSFTNEIFWIIKPIFVRVFNTLYYFLSKPPKMAAQPIIALCYENYDNINEGYYDNFSYTNLNNNILNIECINKFNQISNSIINQYI